MGKYEQLAKDIVSNVGGKNNISGVMHCVTRLRFQLVDESKANDEVIKGMKGVVSLMKSSGQYQVVIGNHVPDVYKDVLEVTGLGDSMAQNTGNQSLSLGAKFLDYVQGFFMPSLAILSASGMIKGLNALAVFAGLFSDTDGIYLLLNGIGDAIFYYFPIIIGFNVAKKLGIRPFTGLIIGAALCYPAINGVDLDLFGYVVNASYTSTVLPVIITVALASVLEKYFDKVIPDVVKTFITPMLTLLISVPLGFALIGPIANQVSQMIAGTVTSIYNLSPILAGVFVGGLWQVLVIFGVHMAVITIAIINIFSGTPDAILALIFGASFAQTAVVFAIWLKTKDKELKSLTIPCWISGIFGVTEAAIYGITLPRIKYFVVSCIGGALAGAYYGLVGLKGYTMTGLGIFGIPSYFEPGNTGGSLMHVFIGLAIAMVFSFVVTYVMYRDPQEGTAKAEDGAAVLKKS